MSTSNTEAEEEAVVKETDPALPSSSSSPTKQGGDQISAVIGNVGRWQLEKVLLVFLASAPGKNKNKP